MLNYVLLAKVIFIYFKNSFFNPCYLQLIFQSFFLATSFQPAQFLFLLTSSNNQTFVFSSGMLLFSGKLERITESCINCFMTSFWSVNFFLVLRS